MFALAVDGMRFTDYMPLSELVLNFGDIDELKLAGFSVWKK